MAVKLYPEDPERRRSRILRDGVVVAMLVFLAWMGVWVYQRVESISVVAEGVTSAGESVDGGFNDAADAVGRLPVVGGPLADALTASGSATGGNVADYGRQGQEAIERTARLVGVITFLIPALLLLGLTVPGRVRGIREMARADQLLRDDGSPERRRLLAMRAAFSLPVDHLLEYSDDPIGDLATGRHDRLLAALYADAGLRPPASAPTSAPPTP